MSQANLKETQRQQVKLSTGQTVSLPMTFTTTGFVANFSVPTAKVKELLPSDQLKPAEIYPGRSIISFHAVQYQEVDAGADYKMPPYSELTICLPVLYQPRFNPPLIPLFFSTGFKGFGFHTLHLPVTSRESMLFGREVYGFPTFLADIIIEEANGVGTCQVQAEGMDILTLQVKKMALKPQSSKMQDFTVKDGYLVKTLSKWVGMAGVKLIAPTASFQLGSHPVAKELNNLEMSQRANTTMWVENVKGEIYMPGERYPLTGQ